VSAEYWARVRRAAQLLGSDGCTGVTQIYRDCCYEHDIAYVTGRTVEGAPLTRAEADAMFRRCIQARSPLRSLSPMAWWRWVGVRLLGHRHGIAWHQPVARRDWPEATP
jgi:hypothetical protein